MALYNAILPSIVQRTTKNTDDITYRQHAAVIIKKYTEDSKL